MPHFHDLRSNRWSVELTPAAVGRVRELLGVDLDQCADAAAGCRLIGELLDSDHSQFINLIFVLCEHQCARLGMSDEDFGRAMVGSIKPAAKAFLGTLREHYPAMRPVIDDILPKSVKNRVKGAFGNLIDKLRRRTMRLG